jgi:hypothetical protein
MILRGVAPGTTLYLEKSVTPFDRRKSSSSNSWPLTSDAGAPRMARIASENMVCSAGSRQNYRGMENRGSSIDDDA